MVETAGNKLRRARQSRHLSLEDAARATKIRAHQLADLEADDYSNFANLAYARSYLVNYAKYLRVDVRVYLEAFDESNTFGMDDYQYLSDKPVGMYRVPYRRTSSRSRRPQRRQLVGIALGLTAMVFGVFGWVVFVNVQRLGDLDKLAARQEAREKAAQGGVVGAETATTTLINASAPDRSAPPAPIPVGEPADIVPAAPTRALPVLAPNSDAPAPTDEPTQVSIPALAATNQAVVVPDPALPLSGGNSAMRELLTAHTSQPQPQKIVNDHPRRE